MEEQDCEDYAREIGNEAVLRLIEVYKAQHPEAERHEASTVKPPAIPAQKPSAEQPSPPTSQTQKSSQSTSTSTLFATNDNIITHMLEFTELETRVLCRRLNKHYLDLSRTMTGKIVMPRWIMVQCLRDPLEGLTGMFPSCKELCFALEPDADDHTSNESLGIAK